jgi:hypothetical protein
MSLLKNAQNVAQPIFGQNEDITFAVEISSPQIWSSCFFYKKTNVNNHPRGEKSPNLGPML